MGTVRQCEINRYMYMCVENDIQFSIDICMNVNKFARQKISLPYWKSGKLCR